MKKKTGAKKVRIAVDREWLRHCKKMSTKAKLDWLEDALRFGKLKKF